MWRWKGTQCVVYKVFMGGNSHQKWGNKEWHSPWGSGENGTLSISRFTTCRLQNIRRQTSLFRVTCFWSVATVSLGKYGNVAAWGFRGCPGFPLCTSGPQSWGQERTFTHASIRLSMWHPWASKRLSFLGGGHSSADGMNYKAVQVAHGPT